MLTRIVTLLALLSPGLSIAQTTTAVAGMALTCPAATAAVQFAACPGGKLVYAVPAMGLYVEGSTVAVTLPPAYGAATHVFAPYQSLADVVACSLAEAPGLTVGYTTDPCSKSKIVVAVQQAGSSSSSGGSSSGSSSGSGSSSSSGSGSSSGGSSGAPVTYQAAITWSSPPTDANGNHVSVTGFNVYQGTTPSTLVKIATVGPTVTTYTVPNLPAGQLYFGVTALDATGESQLVSPLPAVPESVLNLSVVIGAVVP